MNQLLQLTLALLLANPTLAFKTAESGVINPSRFNFGGDHDVAGPLPQVDISAPTADDGKSSDVKASVDPLPLRPLQAGWDISSTLNRTIDFTLDEGTWMNLDVSPDGKQIVFDLLGDIFSLPIEGGEAQLLKGGPEFDIQPSFSPDGSKVLHTSDASGIDNIWITDLKSKKSYPVSNEGYRSVTNGQWSPDGKDIVATKWYTSSRSLGAGTVQRYKVDPSQPSQPQLILTKKTDQLGPEEPIFAPASKSDLIYYSNNDKDTTTWNYSKDPHAGIYNIYQYNTTSKAKAKVTGGVGGAIRPTPSRNGKLLAFVRKIEFNWGLVVRDLDTGNEKIIFDGLSRDNQESTASNGAYPRFSWLPDDSAIIIWAKGKIHRVPLNDSPVKIIPFKAKVNLKVGSTVKSEYNLIEASSEKTFDTKAIQFYDVNKEGTKVVYNAVGQTFVKDLKSGQVTQVKLPNPDDNRHAVSFHSKNDEIIIQSVWNDIKRSSIEIVNIKSNKVLATLSLPTGQYTFPSLSPDGKKVVFTKTSGDELTGTVIFNTKNGVYVGDLDNSYQLVKGSLKITIPGESAAAKFSSDGSKLRLNGYTDPYLFDLKEGEDIQLGSIQDNSGDVTLNHDGTWVAFPQYRQVYVAPAKVNTTYWSKPGSSNPGLVRLSKIGGQAPLFSGPDGNNVYYLLANQLFEGHLPTIQSKCAAEAKTDSYFGVNCVQSLLKTHDLSAKIPISRPSDDKILVLDNATIVTMKSGNPANDIIKSGRLVIKGNKILAVGEASKVPCPNNAQTIDLNGATIVPGFIDEHAHWSGYDFPVKSHWQHQLNLAYGVTTLHNPSYDTIQGFHEQELVRSGRLLAPRIFTTGTILYGAAGTYRVEINNLEEARNALKLVKAYGGFSVKSYNQPSRHTRQMVLQAARELGMLVVPEGGMHFAWNTNQIIDGHTTIEHSLSPGYLYEDLRALFEKTGTAWTPTLIVSYGGIWGENYWYQNTNVWEDPKMRARHPLRALEGASFRKPAADEKEYVFLETAHTLTNLTRRNVLVNPGAHGQRQGVGYLWELFMLSKGGFTNFEVLRAATFNVAKTLGIKQIGSLEEGKLADFNIYPSKSSPLEDIKNLHKISHVAVNGYLHDANSLDQVWPEAKKSLPLPQTNDDVLAHKN